MYPCLLLFEIPSINVLLSSFLIPTEITSDLQIFEIFVIVSKFSSQYNDKYYNNLLH
jgi:hypothetical protein